MVDELDEKKFIESVFVDDYEVMTDTGWVDIVKLHKTVPYIVWHITTKNGYELYAADDHIVFTDKMEEIFLKNLNRSNSIMTVDGPSQIESVECLDYEENMYDLELDYSSNKRYYSNGILSHNTTTTTIFCLWYVMFHMDKKVLIAANKESTAVEIIDRIKLALENIPLWMQPGILTYNKLSVEFNNGSKIMGSSTTSDSFRGQSAHVCYIDEVAAIDNSIMNQFWSAVYPIISSSKDSKCIMVSTPRGIGNLFYETYNNAIMNVNNKDGWKAFRIDWYDVPGRDEEWLNQQLISLNNNRVMFAQEFLNSFHSSSYTLLDPKIIDKFKQFALSDQWFEPEEISIKFTNKKYKRWFKPEINHSYLIGADTADGIGGDSSIILVFDITDGTNIKQVCEFESNSCSTFEFSYILTKLAKYYNEAHIATEANGIGEGVLNMLESVYQYENIINAGRKKRERGIYSHVQTKADACMWTRDLLQHINITLYSKQLINEMETFEKKESKFNIYQAVTGKHDDFMMAFIWAMYTLKQEIIDIYYFVEKYINTPTGIVIPKTVKAGSNSYFIMDDIQKSSNEEEIFDNMLKGNPKLSTNYINNIEKEEDLSFADELIDMIDSDDSENFSMSNQNSFNF